ncbi:hypothetical protein H696_05259 [Fonticula alba]|uniref:Translation initiation factor eIF2B subunit gamma n=1 Tax=Fonticula alba TaxID=691883 RepID=A0A058Z492_FONAL|nr:hypothetical protein H696_05259 [Fonticula alba]KCV68342.1 hypothetical protein H696_05259 [Fonticula alba]|eukprot:XP_009497396.1 hypothetical protein H696_05259 [Fonticula alba]
MSLRTFKNEFQVVILAGGYATKLDPLSSGDVPKALLPIANRPMLHYVLDYFSEMACDDILLITQPSFASKFTEFLHQASPGWKVDLCVVEAQGGTADALREVKDKIRGDFVVVSCDLITNLDIHLVFDIHRKHDSSMTIVTMTPEPSKDDVDGGLFLGTNESGDRLLFYQPVEDTFDSLNVRMAMLRHFPTLKIRRNVLDQHIYVFRNWVLELLDANEHLRSIQYDLVPFLVKAQYRSLGPASTTKSASELFNGTPGPGGPTGATLTDAEKVLSGSYAGVNALIPASTFTPWLSYSSRYAPKALSTVPTFRPQTAVGSPNVVADESAGAADFSQLTADSGDIAQETDFVEPPQRVVCSVVDFSRIRSPTGTALFCRRAATLSAYVRLNLDIHRRSILPIGMEKYLKASEELSTAAKNSGFRVFNSVIGNHCNIGEGVTIRNSIVMDHVTIETGVNLENSVVSAQCTIHRDAFLKDSFLAPGYTVEEEAHHVNDKLYLD